MIKNILLMTLSFVPQILFAADLPTRPVDPSHPGSAQYDYQFKKTSFKSMQRTVDVFLPSSAKNPQQKFPVLVFGHGQAIDLSGYEATFEHLAKKGIAVIFPQFDSGFFDQDWTRMANDFNVLTAEALKQNASVLDSEKIIYSGHSKGGYISLMAAGSKNLTDLNIRLGSVILFSPAGYDKNLITQMNPKIPVTLIWGDADSIIKKSLLDEIYQKLPSQYKQLIVVQSYEQLSADHFYMLTKSFFFGGRNGLSAFQFFGSWKWLFGAVQDVEAGNLKNNPYLYGPEAAETGVSGLLNKIQKSW